MAKMDISEQYKIYSIFCKQAFKQALKSDDKKNAYSQLCLVYNDTENFINKVSNIDTEIKEQEIKELSDSNKKLLFMIEKFEKIIK